MNIKNKCVNSFQKTWYEDNATVFFSAPIFHGKEDCDTLIIGGGLAGLSLQSMLSKYDMSCVLLEEKTIASGASGMNGGFCTPGWSISQLELEQRIGDTKAKLLYDISLSGFYWMENLCNKLSPNISEVKKGVLKACFTGGKEGLKSEVDKFNKKHDANIQFLKGDQLNPHLKSPRYDCGLLDLQSFHFNPLNVIRSLAINVQRKTGQIFEYSKVIDIKRDKAGYIAKTSSGGIIKAKKVVIATGGYFSNIGTSFLSEKLFSLKTSIGVTEPLNANLSGTISSNVAIHDDRRAGNYFRFLPDNRLLWGRDIRAIGIPNKKKIIRDTKRDLKYFFPKQKKFFDKMRVDYSWSGKLGYSSNLMPYISAEKSGLYLLTGFGGHGMNTAPAAANIVKEAILGDKSKMQTFKEFSPKWNGGFLGKYAAEIYLRYLKIRDQIDRI